jgi:CheY-like chemotaxis protein
VLLVEDRESDARWTASILVEHGFRVRVAGTAERALEALEEAAPDALIVDLGLPDMSGAALMERVRKTFPKQRLPIVVLTARELKQQEIAELETLADLVVEKGMMPGTAFAEALSGLCTGVRARPKVLVIDDSDLNRKVMDALLGSAGYTVELATDAESGLILALAEPPALVLMDSRLPGMSGLEATRRLKANPRTQRVPVIVVSAQAMTGDRERALDAGCAAYVTKPVARRDLFEAIDRVMLPAKKPG